MADYVKATNFTAKDSLPSGNSGKIVKGTEIDTELTAVASAIASKANINSPTFTGTAAAPTASTGTNTTQLATTAFVNASILYAVPAGVITLWSGAISSIPVGWSLCNGSSGTPDLRDKFVVGAGTTYAVGDTGGANTVTLDATMIPSHTHSLSASGTTAGSGSHSHTGTTGNQSADHVHSGTTASTSLTGTVTGISESFASGGGAASGVFTKTTGHTVGFTPVQNDSGDGAGFSLDASHTHTFTTGGVSANHTHSFTTSTESTHTHTVTVTGTSGTTGGGLAHENRPPYYALAWIMKL